MYIFRPHTTANCFQLGYVENGVVKTTTSGHCPSGRPVGGVWFNVRVEVSSNSAIISMNNEVVTTVTPHFPLLSATGVIAYNGYQNVFSYKDCFIG